MAEAGSMRFGNSSQPTSTSDLVKTVNKKFSSKTCLLEDEGKTLLETQKADSHDKFEDIFKNLTEYRPDNGFDLIKSVDSEEKVEDFVDKLLPFEHNDDQRLKKQEDIELTSKTLEEFIGESDVGVKWKENLQSHNGSNQKPYIPTDDIAFPDKKAENKDNCLTEVHGQINDVERMELDYSLNAVVESKTSVEPVIVSVAKSNPMSKQNKVCLSNDLFENANDLFGIGNVLVGKGNISVGIGNALVDNSNALFDNGIVSVGNASGNGNATVGIQPDDQSNTLPSLNPYKSMPQKPPDPAQYTISPELREALQANLRIKSEQTRRALQERFHPYKQQKDKSKKFQTSLPILPEFE